MCVSVHVCVCMRIHTYQPVMPQLLRLQGLLLFVFSAKGTTKEDMEQFVKSLQSNLVSVVV